MCNQRKLFCLLLFNLLGSYVDSARLRSQVGEQYPSPDSPISMAKLHFLNVLIEATKVCSTLPIYSSNVINAVAEQDFNFLVETFKTFNTHRRRCSENRRELERIKEQYPSRQFILHEDLFISTTEKISSGLDIIEHSIKYSHIISRQRNLYEEVVSLIPLATLNRFKESMNNVRQACNAITNCT